MATIAMVTVAYLRGESNGVALANGVELTCANDSHQVWGPGRRSGGRGGGQDQLTVPQLFHHSNN